MNASVENRAIAKHVLKAFGGTPRVNAYNHDTDGLSVDLLRCDDRPCRGVTSYSTIGLSDHPMVADGHEAPVRLELAGACATADDFFANTLTSAAFSIMRSRRFHCPGSVLSGYVRAYYRATTVPHLYITAPFLWEDTLKTLDCETKQVSWLLAVPVSDAECAYLREHGDSALEDLFEKHQIDMFDLTRPSVA